MTQAQDCSGLSPGGMVGSGHSQIQDGSLKVDGWVSITLVS